jgi:hypothetical protein
VTPPKLVFLAVGSGAAQTFTASQVNFAGPFTAANGACGGAVLISPASGTTFTVTPVLPAICTLTVNGANGQSTTVAISITQTVGGGS